MTSGVLPSSAPEGGRMEEELTSSSQIPASDEKTSVDLNLSAEPDSGTHTISTSASPEAAERNMTPSGEVDDPDRVIPAEAIYKLTIQPSSGEPFDLQVNSAEMIQELHQVLLERDTTCHRTCFSLRLNDVSLDFFTEIRNVPDLVDGSVLQVVDEPYTVREARIHIRHIRDLLRSAEPAEASGSSDGVSLSYLPIVNVHERGKDTNKDKPFDGHPTENILPGSKDRSLVHVLPASTKPVLALKNLAISAFNPPPGPRKMKGDVLYLYADTLEKRRLHITCCTKGFFVNSSTDDAFNPAPHSQHKNIYHSVVDLLMASSVGFKKTYATLLKRRAERLTLDRLPTPYPVYSWLAPVADVYEDSIRAEDSTQPHRVGFEDHLPGQIRDWNEELQTTHSMPRATLAERVIRDRSVFKIHGDFVGAAVKGALSIIDGNVMSINPADEPKTHMYIWNNIFFSLGFDVKDHYKELGGDAAAFAGTSADLQGVKAYAALDNPKLCTLGMALIDYKGYRITAQSIIPGILDRDQEQSVVYGSVDFGKTVVSSEKYHDLLAESAKELNILPHDVITGDGSVAKLFTSFETKGIIGNDGRQYVLDLLRTMPPDVHFLEDAEVSEKSKKLGFPRKFPHKLASLRREFVELFHDAQCLMFMKTAASQQYSTPEIENEMARVLVLISEGQEAVTEDPLVKEVLRKAAASVDSLNPEGFDVRFNPDCFSSSVKHAPSEDLEKQRKIVINAAEYLLTEKIPYFVQNCLDCSVTPIDGEGLCELMHSRGINVRYLGEVVRLIGDTRSFIRPLAISELVCRSIKHVLRNYMNVNLRQEQLASAVAYLLNSVFGSTNPESAPAVAAEKNGKKGNKKAKKSSSNADGEWTTVTTKQLWKLVCDDALSYYGFKLDVENSDALVEQYGIQKTSMLRRICVTMGIQLLNRDYQLETTKARNPFNEDDIQNMFPVIRHRQPWAADAKKLYSRGQQAMQMGHLRESYEYISESVNLMMSTYGAMHAELAQAMRMLARLSYILGDPTEALAQQHKATIISERCNGLDHGYTIIEYVNLAHFSFANLYISVSLRLLYRARYLLLLAHGENHPIMAQIDGNIGVILFAVQEFDSALKFLQSADAASTANGEPKRLKNAILHHITARAHSQRGDFRAALAAEKETYSIYNNLFGADHEKTKESSDFLRHLTQQAVTFQKRMMDATKGSSIAQILPAQIQQPSLSSILDVLNILNGIIIISMDPTPAEAAAPTAAAPATEGASPSAPVPDIAALSLKEDALD